MTKARLLLSAAVVAATLSPILAGAQTARCEIVGTNRRDRLIGTPGNDVICGRGGPDFIKGKGGNDTLFGQGGRDTIISGPGRDRAQGGPGSDVVDGNGGGDLLFGQGGRDLLRGFGGGDNLQGGGRGDGLYTVDSIGGNDRAFGDAGHDVYDVDPGDVVQTAEEVGSCAGDRSHPPTENPTITEHPTIMAAGDISCPPTYPITDVQCRDGPTSDAVLADMPDAVLGLGNLQYEQGELANFQQGYDPTWGRFKAITRPAPGNHEYGTAGASGYFDYFGGLAGDRTKGYYAFTLGAWRIIALNSNCSEVGGCGPGSPQETWLRQELAAHANVCTMAYWHHPRDSSASAVVPLMQALFDDRGDVVLWGHEHNYQRFVPTNARGSLTPTASGRSSWGRAAEISTHSTRHRPRRASFARNTRSGYYKWL
jgi:hypothetical protein